MADWKGIANMCKSEILQQSRFILDNLLNENNKLLKSSFGTKCQPNRAKLFDLLTLHYIGSNFTDFT